MCSLEKWIIALTFLLTVGATYFNTGSTIWGDLKPAIDQIYLLLIYVYIGFRYYKDRKPNIIVDFCLSGIVISQLFYVLHGVEVSIIRWTNPEASEPELSILCQYAFYPVIPIADFFVVTVFIFGCFRGLVWFRHERKQ